MAGLPGRGGWGRRGRLRPRTRIPVTKKPETLLYQGSDQSPPALTLGPPPRGPLFPDAEATAFRGPLVRRGAPARGAHYLSDGGRAGREQRHAAASTPYVSSKEPSSRSPAAEGAPAGRPRGGPARVQSQGPGSRDPDGVRARPRSPRGASGCRSGLRKGLRVGSACLRDPRRGQTADRRLGALRALGRGDQPGSPAPRLLTERCSQPGEGRRGQRRRAGGRGFCKHVTRPRRGPSGPGEARPAGVSCFPPTGPSSTINSVYQTPARRRCWASCRPLPFALTPPRPPSSGLHADFSFSSLSLCFRRGGPRLPPRWRGPGQLTTPYADSTRSSRAVPHPRPNPAPLSVRGQTGSGSSGWRGRRQTPQPSLDSGFT